MAERQCALSFLFSNTPAQCIYVFCVFSNTPASCIYVFCVISNTPAPCIYVYCTHTHHGSAGHVQHVPTPFSHSNEQEFFSLSLVLSCEKWVLFLCSFRYASCMLSSKTCWRLVQLLQRGLGEHTVRIISDTSIYSAKNKACQRFLGLMM